MHTISVKHTQPRKTKCYTGVFGEYTIQQLINQDKIILDALLIHLPKIRPSNPIDQPIQKLKHKRRIRIDLCDGNNVDVLAFDVEECGGAKGCDWRPDVGGGEDLDAEDVGDGALQVMAVQPRDQHFAFLVEDEDAANHLRGRRGDGGVVMRQCRGGRGREQIPNFTSQYDVGFLLASY